MQDILTIQRLERLQAAAGMILEEAALMKQQLSFTNRNPTSFSGRGARKGRKKGDGKSEIEDYAREFIAKRDARARIKNLNK